MKSKIAPVLAGFVLGLGAIVFGFGVDWPAVARAAVGPGYVDSFEVTCGTASTLIRADGQVSYSCQVPTGGADVYFGDSDVSSSANRGGVASAGQTFGGDVREEYCAVASSTQVIYCRAMVTQKPADAVDGGA
jgi:hypothetical protein